MGIELSVIVPTHDRPRHLARTLHALMAQVMRDFEVVVVADDCGEETFAVLERARKAAPVPLGVVECVERSAARARNLGLAATSGRNCVFLDTDVLVPKDFTRTLRSAFTGSPSAVLLTPMYGNAASSLTWPLLVNNDRAAEMLECSDLLEWASHQMKLRDVRVPFAHPETGSLDHLPAPWVFCWSSAMAVARALIEEIGGFAEAFEVKGSEDIELGMRLSKAGATFTLLPNSYVFHLPHDRDRTREESSDFIHALRLLSMHTTPAMEALCAFDCANANPMIELLGTLTPILGDLARHAASRSAHRDVLCLPNPDLVIGPPPSWLGSSPKTPRVVCPVPANCADQVPLFGFALPFEDKFFRVAVLTYLWQILPERLACRLFDEALRVAEQVFVLKDAALAISEVDIPADRLAAYDTPYWERTRRLRRSFYDYRLAPLAQDHELYSYQLLPS
ncbi:MAG: glycosyltransferase [Bryobacteraceae bacterium]|nr:glycosyltransferase family 2 protein [Solibacteraceae bacterium]MCO5352611.1 glycosyltransferase [Bryobacteraceae bacterium]